MRRVAAGARDGNHDCFVMQMLYAVSYVHPVAVFNDMFGMTCSLLTMTMTKFILKIKTSFEAYKRYMTCSLLMLVKDTRGGPYDTAYM